MSEWISVEERLPKREGLYFVKNMNCHGDVSYNVTHFEKQNEYKDVYLKEYKQVVRITVKEGCNDFPQHNDMFVTEWMEIPQ